MRRVGTFSAGIAAIPGLAAMLDVDEVVDLRRRPAADVDSVVGWGRKPNTHAPRTFATMRGLPYLNLEDGFLRSVGLGIDGAPPLSIVVDPVGVHYDATAPSLLERWLAGESEPPTSLEDVTLRARADALVARLAATGISKYNDGDPRSPLAPRRGTDAPRVLVVDQTPGDLSLALGLAVEGAGGGLATMVEAALAERAEAEILVKPHPDVLRRARDVRTAAAWARHPRVRVIEGYVQPAALLREVDVVYTRTSQMGFEALWFGREVHCFGAPFYAGWGLTNDRVAIARRGRRRTLAELVAAALLLYPRYVDPETGRRCEAERVVDHLALQRRFRTDAPAPLVCVGFSAWKRGFVPPYLGAPRRDVRFVRSARLAAPRTLPAPGAVVAWSSRDLGPAMRYAAMHEAPLVRMEDGFLRSVGLGSDLVAPLSLVLDRSGIYYDPSRPSDLETLLASRAFSDADRARGRRLTERIVATGVSKYVLDERARLPLERAGDRSVVLVIGQVEDDASIAKGCTEVRTNEGLLRATRALRPDAFVVYRPHPDVTLGGRLGAVHEPVARGLADHDATGVDLAHCLAHVDEVHTLTSLVGFESLLRGLHVVVHGIPFYAGWGLTEDRAGAHPSFRRRMRRLTRDELVVGVLAEYPRYVHPRSQAFTTPEAILDHLAEARAAAGATGASALRHPGLRARLVRNARHLARGVRARWRRD